jgi:hypothetical protein
VTEVCEQCPTPLVVDHRYQPTAWPDTCGYRYESGWPCGYAEDEHTERLEGAIGGGDAIEEP